MENIDEYLNNTRVVYFLVGVLLLMSVSLGYWIGLRIWE